MLDVVVIYQMSEVGSEVRSGIGFWDFILVLKKKTQIFCNFDPRLLS